MDDTHAADIDSRRNLLLASVYAHTKRPGDPRFARSARVLRHALIAAELWDVKLDADHLGPFERPEDFPIIELWHSTLVEMVAQTPKSRRLLEGKGNMEGGEAPRFTACRLTPRGRAAAARLLAEHPDWQSKLTTNP